MKPRLPIVGVMGSGTVAHAERASLLGRWLAARGVHLLTGGGGGVMAAVSKAFYESPARRGLVIGVLPGEEGSGRPPYGYPNQWVEIPILTHLPLTGARGSEALSRNHINILTSDVIVALPGSAGTSSEVALAVSYQRPIVAFLDAAGQIPELPSHVPVRSRFAEVCAFVDSCLDGRDSG